MLKIYLRAIALYIDLFFVIILVMIPAALFLQNIEASEALFQVLPFIIIQSVIFPLWSLFSCELFSDRLIFIPVMIGSIIVEILYYFITERFLQGQTVGKGMLGIKTHYIQSFSNKTIFKRSIIKTFSRYLLAIPFIIAFFNDKHQTFHDILSNTIVIGKNEKR